MSNTVSSQYITDLK